jgi:hypothetical protein
MHGPINVKSPNNTSKWQIGFNSLFKGLIKPVLMYGAETWVLSKADELRLGVFDREILRRIYEPICEGAIWRSRYNE